MADKFTRKELFALVEQAQGGSLPTNKSELAVRARACVGFYTESHIKQALRCVASGLERNRPDVVAEWAERLAKFYITD